MQEEFSRGPGGMRMHLHHAADMNWRILEDYGTPEIKGQLMDKFQDKTIYCNFAITEQTGGTGADLHTTAEWDEEKGKWILNGEKWLISHTDCSDYTTLLRSPIRKTTRTRAFLHSSYRLMLLAMSSFRCLT